MVTYEFSGALLLAAVGPGGSFIPDYTAAAVDNRVRGRSHNENGSPGGLARSSVQAAAGVLVRRRQAGPQNDYGAF